MIVTVDAAGVGAAARVSELLALYLRAALVAPGGVTPEAAHRRPGRHSRGRRRRVEAREDAGPINNPATDDRQLGNGIGNVALRAREIIAVGNNQVGELTRLDPSLLAFFVGEPCDVLGPKTQ